MKKSTEDLVFAGVAIFILFIDAVFTLIDAFKRGVMKKEVLIQKTNLGFNLIFHHQ